MRNAVVPRRSAEVIDAECGVIDAEYTMVEPPPRRASLAGLGLIVLGMAVAGGVVHGLWDGDAAFGALVILATVAVCVATTMRRPRRVSEIYRVGLLIGLAGLGLMVLAQSAALMAIGGYICGGAWLLLHWFDKKGWRYEK